MATEALASFVRFNLVASAAIALVFLLRPAARRWFGPQQAYALWLTVPLAMAGALFPPSQTSDAPGLLEAVQGRAEAWLAADLHGRTLIAIWALGLAASVGLVAWRHARFMARVRAGRAGPAIVGVFAPRLVTPEDFAVRFSVDERRMVRAHERAHMDRLDARWNALALALQCLNWFNPLVHAAARAMRFDQELACDATVMARYPNERRCYAETLVRSQDAALLSPLACGWTGRASHPLVTRLTVLLLQRPAEGRRSLGGLLLAVLCTAALSGAWATQPPYRLPETPQLIYVDLTPQALPSPLTVRSAPIGSR